MKNYKPLLLLFVASLVLLAVHFLVFELIGFGQKPFRYSFVELYGFFFACSFTIVFILINIKKKLKDSVGYAFMFLTSLKMVACYFVLRPILHSGSEFIKTDKMNFFIIFALFLAIETIVTIRILNNKQ